MCGRATLVTGVEEIAEIFGVKPVPLGPPRFNLAPGQDLAVVRPVPSSSSSSSSPERELALVRWGLVPWWSKDGKMSGKTIQARGETVARAPAFRDAFKSRRCLVVVDGFYEWSGTGKARQPHRITLPGGRPFAIAGVWDSWKTPEGTRLESCAVVTTAARGRVEPLHDRMPLVLEGEERDLWLGASPEEAKAVITDAHARDAIAERFVVAPVSTWVNDVRHDDAGCFALPGPAKANATADPGKADEHAQTTLRFG